MSVTRVKTSAGWVDLTKVGPTGYDTAPIGGVIFWTGTDGSVSDEWGIADGRRLTRSSFPDAYDFAVQQEAAGNPLWTSRSSDETFTVPNFADKFIYGKGAKALGASGGAEQHTLVLGETPNHVHAAPVGPRGLNVVGSGGGANGYLWHDTAPYYTDSRGSDQPHNNMPPYVVACYIVKLRGVSTANGVIQGPQGAPGGLVWQEATDPTLYSCSGAIVKKGGTIMDIEVTVDDPLQPVFLEFRFTANAQGNSNSQHQLWRNGGRFLITAGPGDFLDWLVGTGTASAQGAIWIGTFLWSSPQSGINGGRQPLMPTFITDWPGVGTHVYTLAHGGTGSGGQVSARTLKVGT